MATARKKILDFTNVKEKGNFNPRQVKEGPHKARIVSVEEGLSKAENEQWVFSIVLPEYPSAVYPYYCALTADSLWKVRNLFVACGVEVPKKKMNVDPNKLVGKNFIAEMIDDEYEGRMKSKVMGVMSLADYKKFLSENDDDTSQADDDDEADDDEEPTPPKKKKKPAPEPEEDDEDEDEPTPPKKKKKAKPADDDDIDLDEV